MNTTSHLTPLLVTTLVAAPVLVLVMLLLYEPARTGRKFHIDRFASEPSLASACGIMSEVPYETLSVETVNGEGAVTVTSLVRLAPLSK